MEKVYLFDDVRADDVTEENRSSGSHAPSRLPVPTKEEFWVEDEQDFENDSLPMNDALTNEGGCHDLALLREVNEAEIMRHLIKLHEKGRSFARCGEIFLVLHPLPFSLPLLSKGVSLTSMAYFDVDNAELCQEEKKEEVSVDHHQLEEPHIYEVSGRAYRSMRESRTDQTIAIMGEANSGKSITASLLVEHFGSLSNEPILKRQIDHACTVFEAFGNAETNWNLNSTRNAHIMSFEFDRVDESLVGAAFRYFMLETTRVVSRSSLERNFNIFYQLLAASSDTKAKVLGDDWAGATSQDFSYLVSTQHSDKEVFGDWDKTSKALLSFGWEGKSLQHLMKATSIVLLLGNVTFSDHLESASIESRADLNMLALSLGVAIEDLEEAMTERQLVTVDGNHFAPQRQAEEAKELCDSLAKAIYECLFVSVCRQINILTSAPPIPSGRPRLINVVDMFGFDFGPHITNGLGQMLVNFANERIHLKYMVECFREKRKIIEKSNSIAAMLDDLNNADTVSVFECQGGILQTVIENAKQAQKKGIGHIVEATRTSSLLIRADKAGQFAVKHFVGDVTYDTELIQADRLPHRIPGRLLRLLSESQNPILSQEFGRLLSGHEHAAKRTIKRRSVTEKFHRELRDLLVHVKSSKLHFVRSIKLTRCDSTNVDHGLILKQIRYGGLVPCASSTEALIRGHKMAEERKRTSAARVLTHWAGKRAKLLLLHRKVHGAATRISSWFRCHHRRREFLSKKSAAAVIARNVKHMQSIRATPEVSQIKHKELDCLDDLKGRKPEDDTSSVVRAEGTKIGDPPVRESFPSENAISNCSAIENHATQHENDERRRLRMLVTELQQNILHAEMHSREMEVEYEERLGEYEREVLVLRQQLAAFESEKAILKGEVEASSGNVESLKEGIRGLQESHKVYLEKVMRAVEKANNEHIRVLEKTKRERDTQIAQLQAEIDSLRRRQKIFDLPPDDKRKKVNRLARKLEELLSPISIANQLSGAEALDVDHIDKCISSKARKLLYRLEDLSSVH